MTSNEEKILQELRQSVITYNEKAAVKAAQKALEDGIDPKNAILHGLSEGMKEVGVKYEKKEYYLPQVLSASHAMNTALALIKPHLKNEAISDNPYKVVMCTVEGDIHSIGKSIVATLLGVSGYDVTDLGTNVPISTIVEAAQEKKADVVGMSTLMTTTMIGMADAINMMNSKGIRDQFKVAIGGAPINWEFVTKIGADVTADNAELAVQSINKLFGRV